MPRLQERVGLHKLKEDLEDLSFSYINGEARDSITNRLSFCVREGSDLVSNIIRELTGLLKEAEISGQVTGRENPATPSGKNAA